MCIFSIFVDGEFGVVLMFFDFQSDDLGGKGVDVNLSKNEIEEQNPILNFLTSYN